MIVDRSECLVVHKQSAFTLIEMMFVITFLSILVGWVVPNVKKAYEDMKMKETFSHIDTFIASIKAFYLIDNEFPGDCTNNRIKKSSAWCLPSSYYTRNLSNSEYTINVQPYRAISYDFDNWLSNDKHKQFYITIFRNPDAYEWYMRLKDKYPTCSNHLDDNHAACLGFWPKLEKYVESDEDYRNRFY